jgi:hypothetical protein
VRKVFWSHGCARSNWTIRRTIRKAHGENTADRDFSCGRVAAQRKDVYRKRELSRCPRCYEVGVAGGDRCSGCLFPGRRPVASEDRLLSGFGNWQIHYWAEAVCAGGPVANAHSRRMNVAPQKSLCNRCAQLHGFHPRYRASLFTAWFMVHCGHFHRRKLFLSGKTSKRYIGIPSFSHLTRGISESVSIPLSFWLGMKYPCELL